MERWTGVLRVSLNPNKPGPCFNVAASLILSPSSKTLTVPSLNAIFFTGDRAEATGIPAIDRLSDSRNIAQILVSKLGGRGGSGVNAWVVGASTFNGPFAVYKELVPTVNSYGEPKGYDPHGFPASSSIAAILSECTKQVRSLILGNSAKPAAANVQFPASPSTASPRTVILGFSKGGTVVNQVVTELAHLKPNSFGNEINNGNPSAESLPELQDPIFPMSQFDLLSSISEFHYVDVGLNCAGANLTDQTVIKKLTRHLSCADASILFAFHGTPRQWCDHRRPWICKEKDIMRQLLEGEVHKCVGKLQVTQRFYFAGKHPDLQMHFEIIEALDIG